MKIRTMRDIPTIQGLRNQSVPTTREQAVTEVARLEHELTRLKRELSMWTANQSKTVERIRRVEQRLSVVQEIVAPNDEEAAERQSGRARASEKAGDDGQGKGKGWKTVDFQY